MRSHIAPSPLVALAAVIAGSVAVCASQLPNKGAAAPTEFRLLPAGVFRSSDGSGRPEGIDGWRTDADIAARLVAAAKARASDYVIDYEHQTLKAADNGLPAPAAGWFRELEWRDDGLYAVGVRWTERAAAMVAAGEYRYISPVFAVAEDGAVLQIAHAGLVNFPGLDGLTDLSALSATLFPPTTQEFLPMKALLIALGLSESATEADALAALSAIRASHTTELTALKGAAPDPSKYVPVSTLTALRGELDASRSELVALKSAARVAEVDGVVSQALSDGKLTPALEPWARDLGKSDLEALKSYLASAPVGIKPGETQTGGKPGSGTATGAAATADELAVCKALGIKPDDFVAARAA